MELSFEDRERISLEEKTRLEAQTALVHAQNADRIRLTFGLIVAVAVIGAVVAGANFLFR